MNYEFKDAEMMPNEEMTELEDGRLVSPGYHTEMEE